MQKNLRSAAVVLAAGRGLRMESDIHKQYMLLGGERVIRYSLEAFEKSPVDDIILVVGPDETELGAQIVREYGLTKVRKIVPGGKERYHSVHAGLKALDESCGIVLIHDGARPFITQEIIGRCLKDAETYGACVAAVPAKDTVKIADSERFVKETPRRDRVWQMQTPQAFEYRLVRGAYDRLEAEGPGGRVITDDAMVVEAFASHPVYLTEGSYQNIKLTTPDDMVIADAFLRAYFFDKKS